MHAAEPPHIEVLDRDDRSRRLTLLARLKEAPFPFEEDGFFQSGVPGERLRTVAGNTYGERPHYSDDRVLIHLPPGFDPALPCAILLYLHGHGSELRRDIVGRHDIPGQVDRSATNTVLIAPQLVRDASDSHSGKLSRPRGMARLLSEVVATLEARFGLATGLLPDAPVLLAAYSGGYRAAADCLSHGGIGARVAGCLLMDALYARLDDFLEWRAASDNTPFFAILYGPGTRDLTLVLGRRLRMAGQTVRRHWPRRLGPGTVALSRSAVPHPDLPTLGPPRWPITQTLRRWHTARFTT